MWDFNFLLYNLTDMSWTLDWLFALFVIRLGLFLFLKPIWDLISISLELCMRFPFLGWSWIKILDFDCLFCCITHLFMKLGRFFTVSTLIPNHTDPNYVRYGLNVFSKTPIPCHPIPILLFGIDTGMTSIPCHLIPCPPLQFLATLS